MIIPATKLYSITYQKSLREVGDGISNLTSVREFSFEPATTRNTCVPLKIKSALGSSVDTQGKQQKTAFVLWHIRIMDRSHRVTRYMGLGRRLFIRLKRTMTLYMYYARIIHVL